MIAISTCEAARRGAKALTDYRAGRIPLHEALYRKHTAWMSVSDVDFEAYLDRIQAKEN